MKKIIHKALSSAVAVALMVPSAVGMITTNANAAHRDPNGDGVINIADAVFIQQYLVGAFILDNITPLDVDNNGIVSYVDAEILQRHDADPEHVALPNVNANIPVNADESYNSLYYKHNCSSSDAASYTTYRLRSSTISNNYGVSPLSIIGSNNEMTHCEDTAIVRIINRDATTESEKLIGTGFIVGNHKIATTAHNVYNYYTGEFMNLAVEIVDTNGNVITYYPNYIHIPKSYTTNSQMEYNYAMLYLNSNLSSYGKFELGVALDSYTNGGSVTVSGFPGTTIPGSNLTSLRAQAPGEITERIFPMRFGHTADTMYGTNGGPVYAIDSCLAASTLVYGNIVIGIQSYSMGSYNEATAITSEVLKFYNSNN